jgi:hypothetical protein
MATLKNITSSDLEVPSLGQVIKAGESIEIDDSLVDGFSAQVSVWEVSQSKSTTKPAAPAETLGE